MSEPNDLSPLFKDPSFGSLLSDAASSHEPSPADLASLGKKLAAALPPGTLPPPGGGGVAPAGAAAKLAAAIGVIALIGAGAYFAGDKREEPVAPAPAASASAERVTSLRLEPLLIEPVPTASAAASAAALAVAPPTPPPPAEAEGTMLARAHDALLHGAPDRALAIANEHAKAYPHGALAQERDAIAIEALVAAGRKPEAQKKAAAFMAAYPGSSHQERIDRLVAP